MQLINSDKLDKHAWDALVERSGGSVFSLSRYLDATADHWAVLYNTNQTGGMICASASKAGLAVLYTPFFHRYSEWIGEDCPTEITLRFNLEQHFRVSEMQWRGGGLQGLERWHQQLSPGTIAYNQQAKRMLKKAAGFEVREAIAVPQLLKLLQQELAPRIGGINAFSLGRLEQLVNAFHGKGLRQYNLYEGENWLGGIWVLEFGKTTLYLKGTTNVEAKNKGGMYLLMQTALLDAARKNHQFDFGGSNAEGVRRFNKSFGAFDVTYQLVQWNNAPLWWKTVKLLRQKWNNR